MSNYRLEESNLPIVSFFAIFRIIMIQLAPMDDTKITSRQEKILNFLLSHPKSTRKEISDEPSRITVIRDINDLEEKGLVVSEGSGRTTTYSIKPEATLLIPIDLKSYFEREADERNPRYKKFNPEIFASFGTLFSPEELELFENGKTRFSETLGGLDKTQIRKELERFAIELSWKSSQIEGNTYSLLETEELIKGRQEAAGHDHSEATMILNHKKAFDMILESSEKFKEISAHDIRTVHSVLVEGMNIEKNTRERAVGITGTTYLPPENRWQIEEALEKLQLGLAKIDDAPSKSLLLLAMLSYIQPFSDGNKRTARMVSNAVLLANGCFPLSYRSVDEVEFKEALVLFYEQNSLYHLKRVFLEQQRFAIETYFK